MGRPVEDTDTCATCHRTLVEQRRWGAMPKSLRKQIGKTHARRYSAATCQTCATWHSRQPEEPAEAYEGGWVRDGRVLRPHPHGSPLKYFGEAS